MDAYDFDIYKGSTFSLGITLRDGDGYAIDLTDYNVSGYLKYRYSDSVKLVDLGLAKIAPYTSGIVTLTIPNTGTAVLPVTLARYDIEIYHTGSGTTDKILQGKVAIYPEVTY